MSTPTLSSYDLAVSSFLEEIGVTFTITARPIPECPPFCVDPFPTPSFPRKTHIHGDKWIITFTRPSTPPFSTPFWDSYHDAEGRWMAKEFWRYAGCQSCNPRNMSLMQKHNCKNATEVASLRHNKPTAYDVLACLEKYPPSPIFSEWCAELGYNSDSVKAHTIWQACLAEYAKVSRFFSSEELEKLHEIAQ